ncbi:Uma2 family endonuclease [Altericista sp. CCNU0014]|uniref:Uma2 family endonuclease n=1 Tax=Altericista sp. CCNU0014 TaxID=3082949 RepID=UPI00384AC8FA
MTVATAKRFTIDEYHQLIQLGFLVEGGALRDGKHERIELIRGELMQMATKGIPHTFCTSRLCRLLDRLLEDRAVIRGQEPIALLPNSEPEPDVVIARGRDTDYLAHHPYSEDILLVVEVADSSLDYDRTTKLTLYAESGIANYWIVNLNAQQLERYSQPYPTAQGEFQYRSKQISLLDESVPIPGFADARLDLKQIFP